MWANDWAAAAAAAARESRLMEPGNGAKADDGQGWYRIVFWAGGHGDYATVTEAQDLSFIYSNSYTALVAMVAMETRFFRFQIEIRKCWPREKRRNH